MIKDRVILFTILFGILTGTAHSQEYPFPQNLTYPHGFIPKTFSTDKLESWYQSYKNQSNLLQKCNGGAIATGTDNGTKVEAMGWAMITAAYMGDKETFDGLYTFYKSNIQSHGMMAWMTNTCGGVRDGGSASDGDLDVAFSLCVAAWQWGDSYREEAVKVINTVKKLITNCSGTSVVVGGYGGNSPYGGCNETDISYYTPAFFRVFAEFTENDAWEKLADDTYTVLNNGANDQTGLVPDWQTWTGGAASGRNHRYAFDACRVPWRMALDYLWNGNEKAKEWCTTISDWAYGVGPKNIKDGYNLDGSPTGRNHNMSYVGAFAVAAMCNSQEIADAFGAEVASMRYDSYWYHAYLGNCYMLTMTGNMFHKDLADGKEGVSRNRDSGRTSDPFTVTIHTNRELIISGIAPGSIVNLTTLRGQLVKRTTTLTAAGVSLNIAPLKSGCYIVSSRSADGTARKSRVVSVY